MFGIENTIFLSLVGFIEHKTHMKILYTATDWLKFWKDLEASRKKINEYDNKSAGTTVHRVGQKSISESAT